MTKGTLCGYVMRITLFVCYINLRGGFSYMLISFNLVIMRDSIEDMRGLIIVRKSYDIS